jgi:hypothetical protein
VLRIATDHPEARPDARTEVVAAPVARAHGIAVPRLLAFQAGEYSLWERVHAETLSALPFLPRAWRELGGELARLHDRVRACDDPNGGLDTPGPYDDPAPPLRVLVARGAVAADAAPRSLWAPDRSSATGPRPRRPSRACAANRRSRTG